jgi:hypothetical protein
VKPLSTRNRAVRLGSLATKSLPLRIARNTRFVATGF